MTAETRNAQTGAVVEAHFIEEVTLTHGDAVVLAAEWGQAVSTNPYLEFSFSGAKAGDSLTCAWRDNKGQSDTADFKVG